MAMPPFGFRSMSSHIVGAPMSPSRFIRRRSQLLRCRATRRAPALLARMERLGSVVVGLVVHSGRSRSSRRPAAQMVSRTARSGSDTSPRVTITMTVAVWSPVRGDSSLACHRRSLQQANQVGCELGGGHGKARVAGHQLQTASECLNCRWRVTSVSQLMRYVREHRRTLANESRCKTTNIEHQRTPAHTLMRT